ncbi:PhoX family protein [Perlucidibaca piscinae]|uniref:PhoX family protein n=1 Tax=Perlucidibaca piscinae TaxID=392589 RepID=UPI0003B6A3AC|nr:PhoX family phosphatase [Perlucidibaca piscinae]
MKLIDQEDIPVSPEHHPHFNEVVERAMSRRTLLKSGVGLSAALFMGGTLSACGGGGSSSGGAVVAPAARLGFSAVPASSGGQVIVPSGYSYQVMAPWGSPLFSTSPAWKGDASETAADQALQVGDNHDGMHFFPLDGATQSDEGLLVMNHEYINLEYFYKPEAGQTYPDVWTLDKVLKAQNGHGISVLHVKRVSGAWQVQIDSPYNRRLTGNSPMQITGPAAGHALMKTSTETSGRIAYGTLNNCGNGFTLWGTYLTCEENFNGYFGANSGTAPADASLLRYGISASGSGYRWHELDDRFDYELEPNEANRFGWIVEIDPFDPTSLPRKRTALGRIKHENAAMTLAADGRVVVYMGDDQANDYVYKFVSAGKYIEGNLANNRNLLDTGKLYVARFLNGDVSGDMMGVGEWVLLDKVANPVLAADARFADQGEVLIKTRLAADAVAATRMDRPEWVAVHPRSGEVYLTLTNNSGRSVTDDANPRTANRFGQIIRWREAGGDAAALAFEWDLFVLAGNPTPAAGQTGLNLGSSNVTVDNTFNSPDGLAFSPNGLLWIQTDGSNANTGRNAGQGNNQMLVADPVSKEIRRFLVGPDGCEVTGITFTPDQKTVFINIQHPGENSGPNAVSDSLLLTDAAAFSNWPEGEPGITGSMGRPRSATVVIWKNDGGVVGV